MTKDELIKAINEKYCKGYISLFNKTSDLADFILSLLAPELEKAEKWDKVVRIVTYADIKPCDGCPLINVDVCNWLCDYAVKVVEALEGGEQCQQLKIYE